MATVAAYAPTTTYPNTPLGQAFRAVAGAIVRGIGTRVFYVTTSGFDTHAGQNPNGVNGTYYGLMATLNDGLIAFYNDLRNQGLLEDTLVMSFSEFGRRINENGELWGPIRRRGDDDGHGGRVNGGLYGTAPNLNPDPNNPTLENSGADVRFETDFRSVYARIIDNWLGGSSPAVLGGDFRNASLTFV